ncbi:MAG: hypothetical protein HEP71_25290 [Roseivirga sp.]|nr:hypothetical protein [Roseivirga sp.]
MINTIGSYRLEGFINPSLHKEMVFAIPIFRLVDEYYRQVISFDLITEMEPVRVDKRFLIQRFRGTYFYNPNTQALYAFLNKGGELIFGDKMKLSEFFKEIVNANDLDPFLLLEIGQFLENYEITKHASDLIKKKMGARLPKVTEKITELTVPKSFALGLWSEKKPKKLKKEELIWQTPTEM